MTAIQRETCSILAGACLKLEDEGSQSFCSAESRESSQSGHCHVSFSKRVREKSRLHFRPRARLHAHCAEPMTPEEAVVTRPERQLASGNLDEQSKDALGHFWARWLMAIEDSTDRWRWYAV